MNAKDLAAAKRLIAQFHDEHVGRPNSHEKYRAAAMFPKAQITLDGTPSAFGLQSVVDGMREMRRHLPAEAPPTICSNWERCRVGDVVAEVPMRWLFPEQDRLFVQEPMRGREPRMVFDCNGFVSAFENISIWCFEKISWPDGSWLWKRTK